MWSDSNLFWTSSPQQGLYFKFLFHFPITLICLLEGKHCDRQLGLNPVWIYIITELLPGGEAMAGWRLRKELRTQGRWDHSGRAREKTEIRSHPKIQKVQKKNPKNTANLSLMLTYPLEKWLPKVHRRYFALQAFAGPCVLEHLCFFRADPWISPCCWGWSKLGYPGCLHLLLLPLCIMAGERGYSILMDFLMISDMFAGLCPQLWGTESLKKSQTHLCAQCYAEVSCFPKCILTSLLFLPGSLRAAASCGCFSDLYTLLLESDDFYLPRRITQSIPHSDTMSLSAHSNCHTAPRRASLSINNTCPDFLNSRSSSLIHLHVNDLSYDKQVHLQLESHLITYFPYYINRNIYCSPLCVELPGNYHDGFCTPLAALTWFNMGWLTSPLTQCFPWMRGRQATYKELVDLCHVWRNRRGWGELIPANWDAPAELWIAQSHSLSTWFNLIPLSLSQWHVCFLPTLLPTNVGTRTASP